MHDHGAVVEQNPAGGATAELRYFQHSGWLVKTAAHVLVFDYVEAIPGGNVLPAALALSPRDLDGKQAVVFVSHGHVDHYWPGIGEWSRQRPGIRYVVGWPDSHLPGAHAMKPHETWSPGDLLVATTGSTDEGVGFLVTVDGLTLYHAGDHARWADQDAKAFDSCDIAPEKVSLCYDPTRTSKRQLLQLVQQYRYDTPLYGRTDIGKILFDKFGVFRLLLLEEI